MTRAPKPTVQTASPEQVRLGLLLAQAKKAQARADVLRRKLQARIIRRLITKFGGVRKAAKAVGQSPGNFANLKAARLARLDLLERLAAHLLQR